MFTYLRTIPRGHPLGRGETTQPMWRGHIQATREPRAHGLRCPLPCGRTELGLQVTRRRSRVSRALNSTRRRRFSERCSDGGRGARAEGPGGAGRVTLVASLLGVLGLPATFCLLSRSPSLCTRRSCSNTPSPHARASDTPEPRDPRGHAPSCRQANPPGRVLTRAQTPRAVWGDTDHRPRPVGDKGAGLPCLHLGTQVSLACHRPVWGHFRHR